MIKKNPGCNCIICANIEKIRSIHAKLTKAERKVFDLLVNSLIDAEVKASYYYDKYGQAKKKKKGK